MSKDYPVPAGFVERETEIKKSRFIARVYPISNRDDVRDRVAEAHRDFPDARHVCWGYQIGRPGSAAEAAMNDDGEPSGTAGKPILSVIQHKDMGDVLVIVIRYFGGIKLGAGGLVRAYAGASESVLSEVGRKVQQIRTQAWLQCDFADEQPVRHWCENNGGEVENIDYGTGVSMVLSLPETLKDEFSAFCDARKLDCRFET